VLLEINYRLSTHRNRGSRMKLFWVGIDTATPWPWAVAALLAVGGFYVFRRTWRHVAAAWQRASEEALPDRSTGGAR
jgi:branched-chain amino acid transport system permease protein